jgi:hypothetical protein
VGLGDGGVDVDGSSSRRHRDTVMPVGDGVGVADRTTDIGGSTTPACSAIQTLSQRERAARAGR